MAAPLKTFIIYAHEDLPFKTSLEKHLRHLVKLQKIVLWSDREIKAGEVWDESIKLNLSEAEVILMLVSADFYFSDYIQDQEFARAKEKFDNKEALLIPILVRTCSWKSYDLIKDLQVLPPAAKSVDLWRSWDEAFTRVAEELEKLADILLAKKDAEEKLKAEQDAIEAQKAQEAAATEKAEKSRHKQDEADWKLTKKEADATDDLQQKIVFYQIYLKDKNNKNHKDEAEEAIEQIEAEQKAAQKIAAQKAKQEQEKVAKAAEEQQRKDDENNWQIALKTNAVEAFDLYLANEDNSLYRKEANEFSKKLKDAAIPKNGQTHRDFPEAPEMVFVKGGTFQMGSNEKESEKPIHPATVSDFWIGKYPVKFSEYDFFCEATGREKPKDEGWGRINLPAINVSWDEANAYCKWLSEKTGNKYRLPTEAEWEFAARGGTLSKNFTYSGSNGIDEVAWYQENAEAKTHKVGHKKPNELGLHDMSGNVWEWCADWYGNYPLNPPKDYAGPESGFVRVIRGGSWRYYPQFCRVAFRFYFKPGLRFNDVVGFRLARTL